MLKASERRRQLWLRKSSSHRTRRWREMDSNFRFRARAEPARRCPRDFRSSPSTVPTSAACKGPAPDRRSADTPSDDQAADGCLDVAAMRIIRSPGRLRRVSTGSAPRARIATPFRLFCSLSPRRTDTRWGGALIRPGFARADERPPIEHFRWRAATVPGNLNSCPAEGDQAAFDRGRIAPGTAASRLTMPIAESRS